MTTSRRSARQIRPRTADDPSQLPRPKRSCPAAATARREPLAPEFRELLREVLEDVARPAVVAISGLIDAAAELEDDAALGRRARELARAYAIARVDRALRQGPSIRETERRCRR